LYCVILKLQFCYQAKVEETGAEVDEVIKEGMALRRWMIGK
jgi:hypothetical protein